MIFLSTKVLVLIPIGRSVLFSNYIGLFFFSKNIFAHHWRSQLRSVQSFSSHKQNKTHKITKMRDISGYTGTSPTNLSPKGKFLGNFTPVLAPKIPSCQTCYKTQKVDIVVAKGSTLDRCPSVFWYLRLRSIWHQNPNKKSKSIMLGLSCVQT